MPSCTPVTQPSKLFGLAGLFLVAAAPSHGAIITDNHGNVGYTTAAECDQAVHQGTAKFYQSFTHQPPLLREGEVSSKTLKLGDIERYKLGACDLGAGASGGRSGVSASLQGSYVPYSPEMTINAYQDKHGDTVRITMMQCDNNFSGPMPRAVAAVSNPEPQAPITSSAPKQVNENGSQCFAEVLIPAQFETKTERVIKVPASTRYEVVPATYKTVTEKVVVRPEFTRQIPVPATYKTVSEKVLVKPASIRQEPIPPSFKTVEEKVLVRPESTRIKVIPATYITEKAPRISKEASVKLTPYPAEFETVTEEVMVAEGYKIWKRGSAWIGQAIDVRPLQSFEVDEFGHVDGNSVSHDWLFADNSNLEDDVMCLVEVPPEYKTISRKVLVKPAGVHEEEIPAEYCDCTITKVDQPARQEVIKVPAEYRTVTRQVVATAASTRDIEIPAQYETVTRQVVDTPASLREEVVAAKYETISRQVVDTPASVKEISVPAEYETLSFKVKVSEPSTERREILCETNATDDKIREIQQALKDAGFDPGPIDGFIRGQTMKAVNAYQQANNLPVDGYLNIETVNALLGNTTQP
jgi:hypothetical protein